MPTSKIDGATQIQDASVPNSKLSALFSDAEGDPTAVAVASADGTSAYAARRDHVHQGDWIILEDINLTSGDQASFDFQSIPSTYKHLKIELAGRSTRAAQTSDSAILKFNNDTGNNYIGMIQWDGQAGKSEQSTAGAPTTFLFVAAAGSPTSYFSNSELTIFNYANGYTYHTWQARGMQIETNSANKFWVYDAMGMYLSTTAISRITLTPSNGSWAQHSRATLYGLR